MATDKYPHLNVVMPMDEAALAGVRARLDPGRAIAGGAFTPLPGGPADGKGSRREVRPGEWIDDRKINIGGPSSPSKDSPPELPARDVPASYDPTKVYQVQLSKGVMCDGRMLSPGKLYQMIGSVCTTLSASIIDAVELGDVPVEPSPAQDTRQHKSKA